jgi:hypothetical protein
MSALGYIKNIRHVSRQNISNPGKRKIMLEYNYFLRYIEGHFKLDTFLNFILLVANNRQF